MQGSVLHAASEKKVVDPTKQFGLGYCHAPLFHLPATPPPSSPRLPCFGRVAFPRSSPTITQDNILIHSRYAF